MRRPMVMIAWLAAFTGGPALSSQKLCKKFLRHGIITTPEGRGEQSCIFERKRKAVVCVLRIVLGPTYTKTVFYRSLKDVMPQGKGPYRITITRPEKPEFVRSYKYDSRGRIIAEYTKKRQIYWKQYTPEGRPSKGKMFETGLCTGVDIEVRYGAGREIRYFWGGIQLKSNGCANIPIKIVDDYDPEKILVRRTEVYFTGSKVLFTLIVKERGEICPDKTEK